MELRISIQPDGSVKFYTFGSSGVMTEVDAKVIGKTFNHPEALPWNIPATVVVSGKHLKSASAKLRELE